MRTITTKTDVFKFDELSKEAQEKAIEKFRENNLDYDWWDNVYEDFISICKILGIETDSEKIEFTGFWSQGDGACFEGSYSYKENFLNELKNYAPKDYKLLNIAERLQNVQQSADNQLTLTVKHSGHYSHEYCTNFEINRDDEVDPTSEQEKELIDIFRGLMKWLYKTLKAEYDYLQSDEAIKETMETNNYEFTKDGKIFY